MTTSNTATGTSLRPCVPTDPAARLAFSDRVDVGNVSRVVGSGDVAAARARLTGLVGLPPERAVFMEQVHGAAVAVVDAGDAGRGLDDHAHALAGVDALVTTAPDLALVVMVADCVPILLSLPGRAVGAVHAGRRGVQSGVVPAAVEALVQTGGGGADEVVAVLGPAIGGCCYEVPATLAAGLAQEWPESRATTAWGTPALDLPAAVRAQLRAAGVQAVQDVGSCTWCSSGRWFSHRGDTAAGEGRIGRQAGVIARVLDPRRIGLAPYTEGP